jgi:predicted alpha/beta-fold hydrolase
MLRAIVIVSLLSVLGRTSPIQNIEPSFDARTDVKFLVFTQANRLVGQVVQLGDIASLRATNYDARRPTRVIIHGFQNDATSEVNTLITEAYLRSFDFNVVVGKWIGRDN